MKKTLLSTISDFALISANDACSSSTCSIEPTDYSKTNSWSKCETSGTKPVDVFFITGTMVLGYQGTDDGTIHIDDKFRKTLDGSYDNSPLVFEDSCNMYIPYYRQMDFVSSLAVVDAGGAAAYVAALKNSRAYIDITAALDYYFENYNKRKPFIIAGHSQGGAIIRSVLSDYMYKHPDYYKRMVAAYGIGFGFPESYFKEYPHVKAVTGETDTGVVLSWNSELPGATLSSSLVAEDNCLCINPLNWKLDSTYASENENKGSYFDGEIKEKFADACIDLNRHTLVTNTEFETIDPKIGFGDKSLHGKEFRLYFANIQENIAKRIAAFINNR